MAPVKTFTEHKSVQVSLGEYYKWCTPGLVRTHWRLWSDEKCVSFINIVLPVFYSPLVELF